jgi:DNA-binding LytR/AlgR family response regulator
MGGMEGALFAGPLVTRQGGCQLRGMDKSTPNDDSPSPMPQSLKPQSPKPRLALACVDGKLYHLTLGEIILIEADGNYVAIHSALSKAMPPLKTRGILSAYAASLKDVGFVRIHRAKLINASYIQEMTPLPSGDMALQLVEGSVFTASRRYKQALLSRS